jgi:acetyl-CoA C-acetyltransferase
MGAAAASYRRSMGEMLASLSAVAEVNPYAWFPIRRTAAELIEPTPSNRMVGYPYTKTMVAIMDVDMAAALVVASHEAADSLGVPVDRRVYLRGWGEDKDPVYVAEHDPLWASPAMRSASSAALAMAGSGIDDIGHLDLYSCFTSALHLACDALAFRGDDPRGLTVTGGLPFAGGPGSGYLLHSTATMVDCLRQDPGSLGLVSGVGMHMTKHAFDIYSTEPPPSAGILTTTPRPGADAAAPHHRPIRDTYTGPATVATYTVVHDRAGEPAWGLAICDLPSGERGYARIEDRELLRAVEESEWVGAQVQMKSSPDGVNHID